MSATTLAIILLSSIGFLFGVFFSAYLLLLNKHKSHLQLLLGGLLLVLSLRIGKSVFHNFVDLPIVIKNIGLAANLAIGPFLLLYGKVLMQQYPLQRKDLGHFLPATIYVVFSAVIPNKSGDYWWYVSYTFVILQQGGYLAVAMRLVQHWKVAWNHTQHKGFVLLWSAISLIWLTYLLIFLKWIPVYLFGALAYSILVIVLGYFVVKEEYPFIQREKYGQSRLSSKQSQQYLSLLQEKMVQDKSYLNPNLSIQDLAKQTDLSTKVISQVINEQLQLNFSAFINTYRIEEAQNRLTAAAFRDYTIASIAYDCGFNSISSFNTTFKAITQQTPSQFRKTALKKTP